jgi:hypothetical protein
LEAVRFARALVARFFAFVFTATRLAAFLGADLDLVLAFPRFDAVFFRANARFFRLAMSVSFLDRAPT